MSVSILLLMCVQCPDGFLSSRELYDAVSMITTLYYLLCSFDTVEDQRPILYLTAIVTYMSAAFSARPYNVALK